jgi:hypothetical protein
VTDPNYNPDTAAPLETAHGLTHMVDAATGRITHIARGGQLVPVGAPAVTPAPAPAPAPSAPLWRAFAPPLPTISEPHAGQPAPKPTPKPSGPPSVAELKARFAQFR